MLSDINHFGSRAAYCNQFFFEFFPVVTCDMSKTPNVSDAKPVSIPETEALLLPGNVSVTYVCNEGYELKSSNNQASCEYDIQPREGAPAEDKEQLVTAVWRGWDDIRCEKGM